MVNVGWIEIGIRARNDFTREMNSINKQLAKSTREMAKSVNLSGVQKQVQGLGNTLVRQFFDIQTIAKQVVHYITFSFGVQMVRMIEGSISQLISSIKDFDKAITNTAVVAGYTGAAFADARDKIARLAIEIGKNTIYSATQAADALYTLAQAGYDVTKITTDELIPILNYAAATNISLGEAIQDVITVMKQFGLTFEDTTVIVDTFTAVVNATFASAETLRDAFRYTGQIAGALGQSLQETAAVIGVLADRGYEGGTAGQRLNQIFTQLLRPTEQGEKALNELGITVADLNPYTNSLVEVLYKLRDAHFSATDSATLFRARTAGAMITLVNEVDAITALRREIQLSAGITQTFAEKQMMTMNATMQKLQNTTEAAALELRTSLVPVVNFLANTIKGSVVPGIQGFASTLKILTDTARVFKVPLQALLSILLSIGPALLVVGISAKLLAYTLPMIGGSAIVTATKVTVLSTAIKSLFGSLLLAMIPIQIISMIFPDLADECAIFTTALLALVVAWKFHALAVLQTIGRYILYHGLLILVNAQQFILLGSMKLLNALFAIKNALMLAGTYIMVGLAVATHSYAIALALATAGLSLLVAGLAWLITNFGTVADAVGGFVDDITDAIGITKKQAVLTAQEVQQLSDLEVAIRDVTKVEQERLKYQQQMNDMMREGAMDTQAYIEATNNLGNANADFNAKSTKALEISAGLVASIRGYSENLDKAITTTKEYNSLTREKISLESSNSTIAETQTQLLNDYNQAIAEEGINSDKAAQIYEQYVQISGEKVNNDRRLMELTGEINTKLTGAGGLVESTNKLNSEDKRRLDIVNQIIKIQEELLTLYDKIAETQARIARLQSIDANLIKLLTEQNKRLYEQKLKILEAEEALLKLRASEPDLLDEIFSKLADEGLLTQELIDLYTQMAETQGKLMESKMEYFKTISKYTPEERAQIEAAIDTYNTLREQGVSVADAMSQAFGGLTFISPEDLITISNYAEDSYLAADAIKDFSGAIEDLIPVLKELGDVDLISAIYDWLELQPKIELAADDVEEAMFDYMDAFKETAGLIASEWLVVGKKTEKGNWDLTASFQGLIGVMPSLSTAVGIFNGNAAIMVGQLMSSVNGTDLAKDSLDDYSASTLITIGTLVDLATQQGYTITDTTTLDELFGYLGIDGQTAFGLLNSSANTFVTDGSGKAKDSLGELVSKIGDENTSGTLIYSLNEFIDELKDLNSELSKPPPSTFFDNVLWWITHIGDIWGMIFGNGNEKPPAPSMPPGTHGRGGRQMGGITHGPEVALLGEKGAEAIIPLQGANRKYGKELLNYILPTYYPEILRMQQGGVIGGAYDYSTANNENYTITGPVYVTGIASAEDFSQKLKFRMRASR